MDMFKAEKDYVHNLQMVTHLYLAPLLKEKSFRKVSKADIGLIFSNITVITERCKKLTSPQDLKQLHERIRDKFDQLLNNWPVLENIGAMFLSLAPEMKIYGGKSCHRATKQLALSLSLSLPTHRIRWKF